MPAPASRGAVLDGMAQVAARQDLLIVGIIVATVLMMVLPMPTVVADGLIAANIGMSLVLILLALYVRSPVEFSTLPSVILITTAFRLSISITTSRLVLAQGDAGLIIKTFGEFVIAGNVVVGLVVYLIISIVQFVVITKGSERVAEVAARFTLDALPGKQISIDTDVRNGDIDQAEARRRRGLLEKESQLYGAMDGAMKFVKGDAIASLLIIAVNLVGGIAIGCLQRGLPFSKAAQAYSLLAVGDGLIAQIPALLVSLTAGIIVTRATTEGGGNLGEDIARQVTAHARPLQIGGLVLAGLGLVPGFPAALFVGLGAALAGGGLLLGRRHARAETRAFEATVQKAGQEPEAARIEVLVGPGRQGELDALAAGLSGLRRDLEAELGIPVPRLRAAASDAPAPGGVQLLVDGIPLSPGGQADAGAAGIVGLVRRELLGCAGRFVGIQETQGLLTRMEAHYGDLVREAGKSVPLPRLAEVVRRLVDEQVSVANMRAVLEALAEWGPREQSPAGLADHVRVGLRRQICHQWADADKRLAVLLAEGTVDEALRAAMRSHPADPFLGLDAAAVERLAADLRQRLAEPRGAGPARAPVLVTAFDTRRFLRNLLARNGIAMPVLAHPELADEFSTTVVGTVGFHAAAAAGPAADERHRLRAVPPVAA